MKRTTLISASLLLAFAGCTCGQGWRPNILTRLSNRIHGVSNVGEPCDAGCHEAVAGCDTCGGSTAVGYGGYDGQVVDSYTTPVGTTYGGSTQFVPPTYSTPSGTRTEGITPRPTN